MKYLFDFKPWYSILNTIYLLFWQDGKSESKRDVYYDWKEGYIYKWQMRVVLFHKKHFK